MQCIMATARENGYGYGVTAVTIGPRATYYILAHRMAFEKAWGYRLRPAQVVRHTCDTPGCINPLHLQLGTQGDNVRDSVERGRHRNQWQDKTHCINGHEFNEENTYAYKNRRECKPCARDRVDRYRARQ